MIVGVEVRDRGVAAVTSDDSGRITARTLNEDAAPGSVAEAVRSLANGGSTRLGLAVRNPADPAMAELQSAVTAAGIDGLRVVSRGTAVALAEQWCGAARGWTHVVALCASDGVHAGIVVDGRPFEGAHGLAGAAGWLALNPVEREDYRRFGCLEAEIGASGIVRRLVWRVKSGDLSRAVDMVDGDLSSVTIEHVFAAARGGDGVAISVVRDTAKYVGMAIGNLVAVADPDIVVLGGLIADAADLLLDASRTEASRRMPAAVVDRVQIEPAMLGDDAAALGAARAAMLSA